MKEIIKANYHTLCKSGVKKLPQLKMTYVKMSHYAVELKISKFNNALFINIYINFYSFVFLKYLKGCLVQER